MIGAFEKVEWEVVLSLVSEDVREEIAGEVDLAENGNI
jgi:hypothetical protein